MNAEEHPHTPESIDEGLTAAQDSLSTNGALFAPGNVIGGQYCVRSQIGAGGMSDIYLCEDQTLHRKVAVKVMRTMGVKSEQLLRRFQTEGRAIAKLRHKNIIEVYGLDSDHGVPFLVIEYVPGLPLSALLETEAPLSAERVLSIAVQICEGLECAHQGGIIHRDLKPGNIMIANPGATQEDVKILDFGIAKIRQSGNKLTQTGDIFGTPNYMSPEQAQGKPCDALSDQYSLGCILYEMLSGKPPFQAESKLATLIAHTQQAPARLDKIEQPVPRHVIEAVERMLRKDPADRFADINAAKQALLGRTKAQPATKPWLKISLGTALGILVIAAALGMASLPRAKDSHVEPGTKPAPHMVAADPYVAISQGDIEFKKWCKQNPKATTFHCQDYPLMKGKLTDRALVGCAQDVPDLRDMNLSGCANITSDGLRNLVELPLQHLDLCSTDLRNEPLKVLLSFDRLEDLEVSNTEVGDHTCETFPELKHLKRLHVGSTLVTQKGLAQVAKIKELEGLTLNYCRITGGLSQLKPMHLTYLDLGGVELTAQDIETVANMPKLKALILEHCRVTDADLLRLAANHHLTYVDAKRCRLLHEDGVLKFAALNGAQSVQANHMHISGNSLIRDGHDPVVIARPHLVDSPY